MKGILKIINIQERENIFIIMVIGLMDFGWMTKKMEMEHIIIKMVIELLDNTIMEYHMEPILDIVKMEELLRLHIKK